MDGSNNWRKNTSPVESPPTSSAKTGEYSPSVVAPASPYSPGAACSDVAYHPSPIEDPLAAAMSEVGIPSLPSPAASDWEEGGDNYKVEEPLEEPSTPPSSAPCSSPSSVPTEDSSLHEDAFPTQQELTVEATAGNDVASWEELGSRLGQLLGLYQEKGPSATAAEVEAAAQRYQQALHRYMDSTNEDEEVDVIKEVATLDGPSLAPLPQQGELDMPLESTHEAEVATSDGSPQAPLPPREAQPDVNSSAAVESPADHELLGSADRWSEDQKEREARAAWIPERPTEAWPLLMAKVGQVNHTALPDHRNFRPLYLDPAFFFLGAPSHLAEDFQARQLSRIRQEAQAAPGYWGVRHLPAGVQAVRREEKAILPDGTIYMSSTTWVEKPEERQSQSQQHQARGWRIDRDVGRERPFKRLRLD